MSSRHVAVQDQSSVEIASGEIHLTSRPKGWPTLDNFELVETKVPPPIPGGRHQPQSGFPLHISFSQVITGSFITS